MTATPVQATTFVDNPGAVSGEFLYAVRPVALDGTEGEVTKVLAVATDHAWALSVLGADGCHVAPVLATNTIGSDKTYVSGAGISYEYDRINGWPRGTGSTDGAPPSPSGVLVVVADVSGNHQRGSFAHLTWDVADPLALPADLAAAVAGWPRGRALLHHAR